MLDRGTSIRLPYLEPSVMILFDMENSSFLSLKTVICNCKDRCLLFRLVGVQCVNGYSMV